jgi:hypothetical protein
MIRDAQTAGVRWSMQLFFSVVPNVCGTSVYSLLPVTLLTPRILRRLLEFWTTFLLTVLIDKLAKM